MIDTSDLTLRQQESCVLLPGGGRGVSLGAAGSVFLKVVGAQTAGALSVYESNVPGRTAGPPLHLHRSWDEAFYVLEGEMTFLIDGSTHPAPAGTFIFIPRGILHTFWNASEEAARQLTIFTPSGIEDYFDDVTRVLTTGEESLTAAIDLMQRHDMIVPAASQQAYGPLASPDVSVE